LKGWHCAAVARCRQSRDRSPGHAGIVISEQAQVDGLLIQHNVSPELRRDVGDKQEDSAETVARGRDVRDERSNAVPDEWVLERSENKEER
jgi:hypothetical protein